MPGRLPIALARTRRAARLDGLGILRLPVPLGEGRVRAPKPAAQFVQEEPCVVPSQEVGEHVLRVAAAALCVDGLEDGDDVLEEELGVVDAAGCARRGRRVGTSAAAGLSCARGLGRWVGEKIKDLELPPDPRAGSGDQMRRFCEVFRGHVAGSVVHSVGTDMKAIQTVFVDLSTALESRVGRGMDGLDISTVTLASL